MAARTNAWAIIIYPDSAPSNFKQIIADMHIPCALSPLHEPDPGSDEQYKPHYHLLMRYDSVKSYDQVEDDTQALNGTRPERVNVFRSYYRYLCHLDDPEKPQYDINLIQVFSGFDPKEATKPTDTQIYEMIKDIVKYIAENNITYYIDLLLMCMFDDQAPPDWGYTVAHNTTLFSGACESLRKKNRGL